MHYTYKTKGTCSTQIDLDLEGNVLNMLPLPTDVTAT